MPRPRRASQIVARGSKPPPEPAAAPAAEPPGERKLPPAMAHYAEIKAANPGSLLFYRMGDFYELFFDDAVEAGRLLGITVTSRDRHAEHPIPMAGVPYRAVDGYLNRLMRMGKKVVICDQIQDPKEATGLVERAVTRIVTPGTITEDEILPVSRNNYLAAVARDRKVWGIAWLDLSTGTFVVAEPADSRLMDRIVTIAPAEVLVPDTWEFEGDPFVTQLKREGNWLLTARPNHEFRVAEGIAAVKAHFGVKSLEAFGVAAMGPALAAAAAILSYTQATQTHAVGHLQSLVPFDDAGTLVVDRYSVRNLEIWETDRERRRSGSLIGLLDRTKTPMGARLLRAWLSAPLRDPAAIGRRQDAVEELQGRYEPTPASLLTQKPAQDPAAPPPALVPLCDTLARVGDLERIVARVGCGRATPRDLAGLARSLEILPEIRTHLSGARSSMLAYAHEHFDPLDDLRAALSGAIADEPPTTVKDGGIFRDGFDAELDELRQIDRDGTGFLEGLLARETEASGIENLRCGFNRVFGYYLETTRANVARVPKHWTACQSLKNAERFTTPELKAFEGKALGAKERANEREYTLFLALRDRVAGEVRRVQRTANLVALVDVLADFASLGLEHNWVRARVVTGAPFTLRAGRHPVLESLLAADPAGAAIVPNDVVFPDETTLAVLTGPNMSGKSTYIRMAALSVLMGQIGCGVAAAEATFAPVDRVFTRIGASDDLTRGVSTFMVEMIEVATILRHATPASLVVLDEVGRGTSTYDGVAIAWALAEHLVKAVRARTLFATHYHELTALARELAGVKNLTVMVEEWGEEVVFLHKIADGAAKRSYGVQVARLAGVPVPVVDRAREILRDLELAPGRLRVGRTRRGEAPGQAHLFAPAEAPAAAPTPDPMLAALADALRAADVNALTPLQALALLAEWKQRLGGA